MLNSLHIENYVLIKKLDLNFESGFSVITGQTGAGKSILLGALNLVLGARADLKTIKEGTEKCIIEAVFDISKFDIKDFFEENDLLVFEIKADRFLRNMVRAVVGTLLEVGRGKLSLEQFRGVIENKNRCSAGTSMPAHALFLENVEY